MENMYREYLNDILEEIETKKRRIEELTKALREAEDEDEAFSLQHSIGCIEHDISGLEDEYDEYEEAGREEEY